MILRLVWREADHRYLQATPNDLSNLPHQYGLFGDRVVPGASFVLLERQTIKLGDIENVRRRPTVLPLADVRGNTLFAGNPDRGGNKTLLDRVMDLRKTND